MQDAGKVRGYAGYQMGDWLGGKKAPSTAILTTPEAFHPLSPMIPASGLCSSMA